MEHIYKELVIEIKSLIETEKFIYENVIENIQNISNYLETNKKERLLNVAIRINEEHKRILLEKIASKIDNNILDKNFEHLNSENLNIKINKRMDEIVDANFELMSNAEKKEIDKKLNALDSIKETIKTNKY
jgi:hypothetical protein